MILYHPRVMIHFLLIATLHSLSLEPAIHPDFPLAPSNFALFQRIFGALQVQMKASRLRNASWSSILLTIRMYVGYYIVPLKKS